MASNINAADIDELYPVAGVDNDSQGFRDNFNLIKNGLATAKTEITTLQDTTAKLNITNDFNGNIIQEAKFLRTTEDVFTTDTITAGQNISFNNGHYQNITVGGDVTLTLTDWPASGVLGRIRLNIKSDGTARTITWSAGTLRTNSTFPSPFVVSADSTAPVFVDFWSTDQGTVVYGLYHGQFT